MSDYPPLLHTPPAPPPAIEAATGPLILRRQQAAALIGVSPSTFDRWAAAGLAPAGRRVGTVLVWTRDELREWVAAGLPPAAEWAARWAQLLRRRR